jgi:hypothetical protein
VTATGRPRGRPPIGPEIKTRVSPDLLDLLRRRAAERDQKFAALVRDAITRGVEVLDEEEAASRTA